MQYKLIADGSLKTFVLVFATGDEVSSALTGFAKREGIAGAHFTGIGAFSHATVAFFDLQRKE